MRNLPESQRFELGALKVLLSHGSPRKMNEFLWESTTSTHFLDFLAAEFETDDMLVTHTGLKWQRELRGGKRLVNVGVLGRPENDGSTCVWYTLLTCRGNELEVEFVPVQYDHQQLARDMRGEQLPEVSRQPAQCRRDAPDHRARGQQPFAAAAVGRVTDR